jgi:hypothetical protein
MPAETAGGVYYDKFLEGKDLKMFYDTSSRQCDGGKL